MPSRAVERMDSQAAIASEIWRLPIRIAHRSKLHIPQHQGSCRTRAACRHPE